MHTMNAYAQPRFVPEFTRAFRTAWMFCLFVVLSGCAGGLTQSFQQSLSIITPKNIDFEELEYYAKRSKSAYDPISQIRKDYPLTKRAVTVQPADVRYFIEVDKANGHQTLSVRGTAEQQNVWEDIETTLVPDSVLGINLHSGFQADAAAVFKDATPHIRKDLPLRITGHSLGGAVAAILAAYYAKEGYTVERVVTFGQPRVATVLPEGATTLLVSTRVINDRDVVPMVPPHTAAAPYHHFGPEVILREGPNYVFLNAHDADRLSIGDFWRNITDFSTKDHHMEGYLGNIQGKVKNGSRQVPYLFKVPPQSAAAAATN